MSILNLHCKSSVLSTLLGKTLSQIQRSAVRSYVRSQVVKVTVCGAAGHVGRPLCLMLKQSPLIEELAVYDIAETCGFATELGHVDTKCKVSAYSGTDNIHKALRDAKVVVTVAASPKSTFLSYSQMFKPNAHIVQDIAEKVAQHCPKALLAVASNPVNSLVPLVSEILKVKGVYNPRAVFGVTTLNVVRANTFVANVQGLEPECVMVPVIGGHADKTIVPVLSNASPCCDFTDQELEKLTIDIQNAHEDILKAKSKQSATLSCAFAVARFVISLVKGIRQQSNIVECAYVRSDVYPNAKYLATPLLLGSSGIQKNLGIPNLSEYETCLLENAVPLIMDDVKTGEQYIQEASLPVEESSDTKPSLQKQVGQ